MTFYPLNYSITGLDSAKGKSMTLVELYAPNTLPTYFHIIFVNGTILLCRQIINQFV